MVVAIHVQKRWRLICRRRSRQWSRTNSVEPIDNTQRVERHNQSVACHVFGKFAVLPRKLIYLLVVVDDGYRGRTVTGESCIDGVGKPYEERLILLD